MFGYARKEVIHVPPNQTTEETFLAMCREGRHSRSIELYQRINKLKMEREDSGDEIRWGALGYSYRMRRRIKGTFEAPIVGYPDGNVAIRFSTIENCGEAGQKYLQRLISIPTFANKIGDYTAHSEQGFRIDGMTSKEVDDYISALCELGQAIDKEAR